MQILRQVLLIFVCLLSTAAEVRSDMILTGAGATFPYPLYRKWFQVYPEETGVRIDYQSVGSGEGIRRLLNRTVDFGATDAFLSDAEMENAPAEILHIPTCLSAVGVVFHLPGVAELKLTPERVADIFLGRIIRWNDERIARINPGVVLPSLNIHVIHRSDSSGTTFVFTDYLSRVSPAWAETVGRGKTVAWPVGMGLERNANVAEFTRKIPGSIGYVTLNYARQNGLAAALIRNRAGRFIPPTLASVSAAAEVDLPDDGRIMITDTTAPDGYPISAFTYLIFYKDQAYFHRPPEKARALSRLFLWMISTGQQYASPLSYAPLPPDGVVCAERIIRSMTFEGEPLAVGR